MKDFYKKTNRYDLETNTILKRMVEDENKIRKQLKQNKTTENEITIIALHELYRNRYDPKYEQLRKKNDNPTEVLSKLLEKYYNVICNTLNSILEEQQIVSINSKLQALHDKVIADNYNYGYGRLIEDLRNYEKKLSKIIREYDDQVVIDEKKDKGETNDERRFFDEDDGRQIF